MNLLNDKLFKQNSSVLVTSHENIDKTLRRGHIYDSQFIDNHRTRLSTLA